MAVALGFLLALPAKPTDDEALGKSYDDARTGLRIQYPSNWRLDDWPVFAIVNSAPKERPRQNIVPMSGGQIVIMASPEHFANIDEWLRFDKIPAPGDRVGKTTLHTAHFGSIAAIQVDYEEPQIPGGKGRIYYFMVGGRLVKAKLFYRGLDRLDYFTNVFAAVIRNLDLTKQ